MSKGKEKMRRKYRKEELSPLNDT